MIVVALALGVAAPASGHRKGAEPIDPTPVWGFDGHRVVCEIAWQELSQQARGEVRRLTVEYGAFDTFAASCVWADLVEAKAIHNAHWVNLPQGSEAVTMADCPADCLLRHLDTEVSVLNDPAADDPSRTRALMFVAHFMGDLHTPVHVAYGSDRGGNGHPIEGLGPTIDDLHGVWDRYIIEDRASDWRGYGAALHRDVNPIDRTLWLQGDPLEWANDTYRIVEDYVYENLEGPDGSRLGPGYAEQNLRTAERQLKKAGVRLGAMINQALGSP